MDFDPARTFHQRRTIREDGYELPAFDLRSRRSSMLFAWTEGQVGGGDGGRLGALTVSVVGTVQEFSFEDAEALRDWLSDMLDEEEAE